VLPKVLRTPFKLSTMLRGFWINPIAHPDFGWTLLGRILVNLGNALGTTLLLYFLMYGLGRGANAQDDLLVLTAIYLVFFIIAALGFGRLSDYIGRRKGFVYVAAYLQAFAALLLALVPDLTIASIAAGLLGLGYGCYMAVDQALAPITATTSPGQTLEWVAGAPGETFDVSWQPGLCQNGTPNPIPASYEKPARCTVAPQQFAKPDTLIVYTYVLNGIVEGKPYRSLQYKMAVGPGGCKSCRLYQP